MKLSIIVPVYNAEAYLGKCIESIQKQTFDDFELILVDDGSKDSSGSICDVYAQSDSRIKVIHQENKGVSSARNAGLDYSNGEYFAFVDSDDWVDDCIYERLFEDIYKYKADIASCNIWENDKISFASNKEEITVELSNEEAMKYLLRGKLIRGVLWNKVYSRELLQGLRFYKDIFVAEDALFNVGIFSKAQIVTYNGNKMYHYVYRKDSAAHGEFNIKKLTEISARENVLNIIRQRYPALEDIAFSRYVETIVMLGAKMAVSDTATKRLFEENQKLILKNKAKIFTNKIINKRFKKHVYLQLHSYEFCRKFYSVTSKGRMISRWLVKKANSIIT